MDMLCQFGPVTVLFQGFPQQPLWPFWRWKLDPFRIKSGAADMVINFCHQPVSPEGTPVWQDSGVQVCRQLYICADGTLIWQQIAPNSGNLLLQFAVSPDWKNITLTQDLSPTAGMAAFESLTFLIFYALLQQHVLTFHGTLVEVNGKGFLLCGVSGAGKTTHARLWRDHKNALILNGDRATCYLLEGHWFGFGTPWCGTSGEYLNRQVPLQAIVILEHGSKNCVSSESALALLPYTVYPSWDRTATETALSLLDRFSETIPVLRFACTPDASAVDTLSHALENLSL